MVETRWWIKQFEARKVANGGTLPYISTEAALAQSRVYFGAIHLQSMSRHFNFYSQYLIMWLWAVCFLAVAASSQSQLYLNNFGKNKESRLLSKIQSPLPLERSNDNQINTKQTLKTYAIDPRMSHVLYGKDYDKKLLALPIISDETRTMDLLNNIEQTEGVIGYLNRIKQTTPDAAGAIYNRQDSEEEDIDDDYDDFKIQLSDGRLDDDGRIFFNIDDSRNTI